MNEQAPWAAITGSVTNPPNSFHNICISSACSEESLRRLSRHTQAHPSIIQIYTAPALKFPDPVQERKLKSDKT